ncbi:hypothetical protein SZN_29802 [Streptomyces zinciresistens K42]|uniref:DUF6895 domain-containing protein n=1 Tax=Streptomyces zinciresistens K42 TaxID=700597 RepID=G2GKB7_9ACTN|nr:hypothetical protein [Streptomyces zinciresistens]EGX56061.1 hypothetical protein SZN_29802 [Streptomyces zinciresistens K42]
MTALDVPGIRQVGADAFTWLSAHRDAFALGEDALTEDGHVDATWKPLGELAQTCASVCAVTTPADPLHAPAAALLDFAWLQTGRGELFPRLQRLEPFATYPLEVYSVFASAGLRHPGYEAAAATTARTRGWRSVEQDPTRRLGVLKAERRSGIRRPERAAPLLRRTWLGGLPEPWTFERSSGYALTHVVFHLTDWGRAPAGLPAGLAAYLTHWLPSWLDTCLDAGLWDLGCELVVVAASLPEPPDPALLRDVWPRIARAQLPSGALEQQAPQDGADTEPDFLRCYHSTLMAAFAAARTVTRLPGADGPGRPPAHDGRHRHRGPGEHSEHRERRERSGPSGPRGEGVPG